MSLNRPSGSRLGAVVATRCALVCAAAALLGCGPSIGATTTIDGVVHVFEGRANDQDIWKPAWINAPQAHASGAIAAVGIYGPVRYQETGRERVIKDGFENLGRAVSVRVRSAVQSLALDRADLFRGSDASRLFIKTMAEQASDVELTGAVVERMWTHPVSGMNYALVSIGGERVQEAVKPMVERVARENQGVFVERRVADAMRELDRAVQRGLTDAR